MRTPDELTRFALVTPPSLDGGPSLIDAMIWVIGKLGLISLIVSAFQNNTGWISGQNLARLSLGFNLLSMWMKYSILAKIASQTPW
jgi:hypothetical protein